MTVKVNTTFEKQYQMNGFASQRRYPNEALLQFIGSNYFNIPNEDRNSIKMLEIGCGSGSNLWMVAREGFDAYGIDFAPTGIDLCNQMLDQWGVSATLKVESMCSLSFPDMFFDVAFDITSMQHLDLDGHLQAYREVYRCLKPGGRFFQWHLGSNSISFIDGHGRAIDRLTIDNISNPEAPLYNNGMTCFLTPTDAYDLLDKSGFKDIVIESAVRTYKNRTQSMEYLAITATR